MRVDEHTIELAAAPVFYRSAAAADPPPVFLHGVPASSDDWEAALALTGGIAPDLLGFGRSAKAGNLEFSLPGQAAFVLALLDELAIDTARLAGTQWGALVALEIAAQAPERVERLALIEPPRLLSGHAWSRLERAWRTPLLGELTMGSTTRWLLGRWLRTGALPPTPVPGRDEAAQLESMWGHFDQGTQRAVLRLYRSTEADHLSRLAPRLGALRCPVLALGAAGSGPEGVATLRSESSLPWDALLPAAARGSAPGDLDALAAFLRAEV